MNKIYLKAENESNEKRRIIQILNVEETGVTCAYLIALCNDGTIWFNGNCDWEQFNKPIPQEDETK